MTMAPAGSTRLPGRGRRERFPAGRSIARSTGPRGLTLLEMVVTLTLILIALAAAIPQTASYVRESRLRGAAFYLRGLLRETRARAAREARYVGVVFDEVDGDPVFSIYADGNSNGIHRLDIDRGIEERVREPYPLCVTFPGVRYGNLPVGADSPYFPSLQIGRSKIVSFSPIGAATSGTLYLSNDYGMVYAVVILGSTGRVRVARYHGGKWQAM
jgi:prepilin-type N-terminal cleavage/methylation domain-containing protein